MLHELAISCVLAMLLGSACGDESVTLGGTESEAETSSDAGAAASSSGDVAECGNAWVEGDEECDDGNPIPLDGCEPDCTNTSNVLVYSGPFHTCALLRSEGRVRCWGADSAGQLGYGRLVPGCTPDNVFACRNDPSCCLGDDDVPKDAGAVAAGGPVRHLALGIRHTCALLMNGAVRCWGSAISGVLAKPRPAECWPPEGYSCTLHPDCCLGDDETVAVAGDIDLGGAATQITAGDLHTCALMDGGGVRCWGSGLGGSLGYGNQLDIGDDDSPASAGDVELGGPAVQIAAASGRTCAVLESGAVRCWGNCGADLGGTYGGCLGYGNPSEPIGDDEVPASMPELRFDQAVTYVSSGRGHTCVVLQGGTVRCWGGGSLGYPGTGPIYDASKVDDVQLGSPARMIAVGNAHTCAITGGGDVRCWGDNYHGELGYGNTIPVGDDEPPEAAGVVLLGGAARQIAAGDYHTCAVLETTGVRCWGRGSDLTDPPELEGVLGYGDTEKVGDDEHPRDAGDVQVF